MEKNDLWQAALAKLEPSISRPNFLTRFQETGITGIEDGLATVFVPNGFVNERLHNKYNKFILHALQQITPEKKDVSYLKERPQRSLHAPLAKDAPKKRRSTSGGASLSDDLSIRELSVNPETNLNPRYSFSNFIVGSFNELAYAAAQSIIKNPGTSYNPLFIYGGVGLGKTHLIQAIGNEVLRQNAQKKVRYVSSEKYMGDVVDALRNQEMNNLKEKYRSVDLLIMDDIQFMARTEKMQEEFFHTFNALYEKNKQIIISSDRPPQAISTLEERLRSRFEGGMIADIGLPDYETRLTILKLKAETKKIMIPEDVLAFIAGEVKNNIRELEGSLNRVIMSSKLSNKPLDVEAAKKSILEHISSPKKFISAKKIIKAIAEFYDIEEKDLVTRSRKKDFVKPRQIAMYLMRKELESSYPSIGERFGGTDHTTAIHSCEKIDNELRTSHELQEEIQAIKDKIFLD